jgi:hypothetical protein
MERARDTALVHLCVVLVANTLHPYLNSAIIGQVLWSIRGSRSCIASDGLSVPACLALLG